MDFYVLMLYVVFVSGLLDVVWSIFFIGVGRLFMIVYECGDFLVDVGVEDYSVKGLFYRGWFMNIIFLRVFWIDNFCYEVGYDCYVEDENFVIVWNVFLLVYNVLGINIWEVIVGFNGLLCVWYSCYVVMIDYNIIVLKVCYFVYVFSFNF